MSARRSRFSCEGNSLFWAHSFSPYLGGKGARARAGSDFSETERFWRWKYFLEKSPLVFHLGRCAVARLRDQDTPICLTESAILSLKTHEFHVYHRWKTWIFQYRIAENIPNRWKHWRWWLRLAAVRGLQTACHDMIRLVEERAFKSNLWLLFLQRDRSLSGQMCAMIYGEKTHADLVGTSH
jgi:hypothetical protein